MKLIKYEWELIGTIEQFQKIFSGLDFMNGQPKNKIYKLTVHTNDRFEKLRFKWWLKFPPKNHVRTFELGK